MSWKEADAIRAEMDALEPGASVEYAELDYCLGVELRLAARA